MILNFPESSSSAQTGVCVCVRARGAVRTESGEFFTYRLESAASVAAFCFDGFSSVGTRLPS